MKTCPTCKTIMRPLGDHGAYCPNSKCADGYAADDGSAPDLRTVGHVPGSLIVTSNDTCGACGSSDIAPFHLNGVTRRHCWGCGAVTALGEQT